MPRQNGITICLLSQSTKSTKSAHSGGRKTPRARAGIWTVNSEATVKLITKALGAVASDKMVGVGRAEALRRSMRALIKKGAAHEAHPALLGTLRGGR